MKQLINFTLIGVFVFVFFSGPVAAEDLATSSFILRDPAFSVMGGRIDATSFQQINAASQGLIGENNSSNYVNQSGILYFTLPSSSSGGSSGGGGAGSGAGPAPTPAIFSYATSLLELLKKPLFISKDRIIGDFNQDSRVDIYDVSILLHNWNVRLDKNLLANAKIIVLPEVDMNNDGLVDIKDLSILLYHWTN